MSSLPFTFTIFPRKKNFFLLYGARCFETYICFIPATVSPFLFKPVFQGCGAKPLHCFLQKRPPVVSAKNNRLRRPFHPGLGWSGRVQKCRLYFLGDTMLLYEGYYIEKSVWNNNVVIGILYLWYILIGISNPHGFCGS